MSPEQVTAKRMGLDHRADVFRLRVVLYELLTLRRPFKGDTTHQVAAQIIAGDPTDASEIHSQCPRQLAVICGKALEKFPESRYASVATLEADLRRHLASSERLQLRVLFPGAASFIHAGKTLDGLAASRFQRGKQLYVAIARGK